MKPDFRSIADFIKAYFPNQDFIPLHAPVFFGNESKYVQNAIDSTYVSSVGEYVNSTETFLERYLSVNKAVATVNGTAALQVALKLSNVGYGDLVLTQALSFIATANAISFLGAKPIFIDVDLDTMGLSPFSLKNFLETNCELRNSQCYLKSTNECVKACVPMHTFGFACRIKEIKVICDKWHLKLVEDAAEALGSTLDGHHLGTFGDFGTISFNGNKIATSGGGGMIVTNNEDLGKKAKHITTTAKVPHKWEFVHDEIGYNFRMPNLNAALLLGQLEQLDHFIKIKRERVDAMAKFFQEQGIVFRKEMENTKVNYWLYTIEMENLDERNAFLDFTNKSGIMTRPIWKLLSDLPMYNDCTTDGLKNSKYLEERIINLPSSAN